MSSVAAANLDETQLIDALRQRDQSAFMRLVSEYGPRMPQALHEEQARIRQALQNADTSPL